MKPNARIAWVNNGLILCFLALGGAFVMNLWAHTAKLEAIPLVDPQFIQTNTARMSAADLIKSGGDTSGLECYVCHDKKKPVKLVFDAQNNVVLPKEHEDIVMGHGTHKRNNNCFNCHDETNLELLATRDGRQVKIVDSPQLCGSCHGPTYRDWEAGVHGRTSGYWKRDMGPIDRKNCTSCHNPHAPPFPSRQPAPAPHLLHPVSHPVTESERSH